MKLYNSSYLHHHFLQPRQNTYFESDLVLNLFLKDFLNLTYLEKLVEVLLKTLFSI